MVRMNRVRNIRGNNEMTGGDGRVWNNNFIIFRREGVV